MESNGRPDNVSAYARHIDDACARCGGLMVMEHYIDLHDDTGQIGMTAWRCTSCGEVIDPTILRHREKLIPNLLYGMKQRSTRNGWIRMNPTVLAAAAAMEVVKQRRATDLDLCPYGWFNANRR